MSASPRLLPNREALVSLMFRRDPANRAPMPYAWVFYVITVGCTVAGIVMLFFPLVRPLGEALFIAGFLALTVDQYVTLKLLKDASWDIMKFLLGYGLPDEMQDRIKKMMSEPIIRKNDSVHYIIEPDGNETVRIRGTRSYEIENITNHPVDHKHGIWLEKRDRPEVLTMKVISSDKGHKSGYELTTLEEIRSHQTEESGFVKTMYDHIVVKPNSNNRGPTYKFISTFIIHKRKEDNDVVTFGNPVINVAIHAFCPDDIEFIAPDATTAAPPLWDYKRLFLGGEHIHVRWFPKKLTSV